jgi:hypothetical protein
VRESYGEWERKKWSSGLSVFRDRVGRKRMEEELGRVRLKGLSA